MTCNFILENDYDSFKDKFSVRFKKDFRKGFALTLRGNPKAGNRDCREKRRAFGEQPRRGGADGRVAPRV